MAIKNRAEFVVPPLVRQNISRSWAHPKWMRYDFLVSLTHRLGWKRGAEIGLWEGVTIDRLLRDTKIEHMIGVDLWEPQPGNVGPEGYEGWDHAKHEKKCRDRLSVYDPRRYTLHKGWSAHAAAATEDESLDFIFIDADHSYEGALSDMILWCPKLKPTGWVLGHDINWEGVRRAVEQKMPGYLIGPNVVWFRPLNPAPDWQKEWL